MKNQKSGMLAAALLLMAACGGGGGGDDPVIGPPPVARIVVSPDAPTMTLGASLQLKAALFDSNNQPIQGRTVQWSSSDTSVATVSASGLVSALKAGPARITAAVGNTQGSVNVAVSDPPPAAVSRVVVSPAASTIQEGATKEFSATVYDDQNKVITGRGITWTVQNPAIATIDGGGIVTALRSGATAATARVDGKSASASVSIEAHYPFELMYGRYATGTNPALNLLNLRDPAAIARSINTGAGAPEQAVPSPDGLRIAFVVSGLSSSSIYVANRDGSNPRALISDGNRNDQPSWSPDGTKIAFRHRPTGSGTDIWVVNSADGSGAINLTANHGATNQSSPAWSPVLPDGSVWIAYSHAENGAARIWAMRSDGIGHRAVTSNTTVYDDQPDWSPDGQRIVFQRSGTAIFGDIYVVNAAGGNGGLLMQLAGPLAGTQSAPSWSPDGQLVAFASRHDGNYYQVYTVWYDGTRLARRTSEEADHDYPRWMMEAN